jgi:hypothetical protein
MKYNKFKIFLIFFYLIGVNLTILAQIENENNTIKFEVIEDDFKTPEGLELPAIKLPSIIKPQNLFKATDFSGLGEKTSETLDITHEDDFLDLKTDETPKYFTKDKAISEEFGHDQYLGELTTSSLNVTFMYRDHEYVDGDRVRIFVNGDIVKSSVYLTSGFKGFTFHLQSGFNKVEFQALNQGSSGPNTAELRIFDDAGVVLSANQWNLNTGRKAMVTIIKE